MIQGPEDNFKIREKEMISRNKKKFLLRIQYRTQFFSYGSTLENVSGFEFLCRIDFFQFNSFYKINIQIAELKNFFNYPTWTSVSIQHFLYPIKYNNWMFQIIDFLSFKFKDFFKFHIDIETNSEFFIIIKLGYQICQISTTFRFSYVKLQNWLLIYIDKRPNSCWFCMLRVTRWLGKNHPIFWKVAK